METTIATGMRRIILFTCLFFHAFPIWAQQKTLPKAPSFIVRDINNKLISTDSLIRHGPLIIDFWATWCAPCLAEFKTIKKIVAANKDKNLKVLAISQDAPSEIAKVKQTAKTRRLPFIIAIDTDKSIGQKYFISALPSLYLIGTDGNVHLHTRGFVTSDEGKLEKAIREILEHK
jgi:peroxiredoxin